MNPFSNSCSKGDIGPCFDAIWNHLVTCPVEKVYSFNGNDICTRTTNVCSHIIEKGHDVNNLRFTSSVFNNSTTFRLNSSQNGINSCSNANRIHIDSCATETLPICGKVHTRTIHGHLSAHRLKGFQMQINGTWT